MKRHRLPSAFAARAVLGLAGILAVTACGSLTQTGTQTGLQASLRAGASATYRAGNASSQPSTAAPSSPAPSSPAPSPARPSSAAPSPTAAASTVVFDCLEQARVEPANFILTCADDNSVLGRLSWTSWTAEQAIATGVHELNGCTPDCAMGTFHDYPAVVTFWRSEPAAGHPGERYFTRITVRYTGPRPPAYTSNGNLVKNPATWTEGLCLCGGA
jgi:hypothetical protein